ncbi:hypothetical protein HJFPF1_05523 [Paramyrothecium foliicola]|nr:hypothetical protein HJFPF1_05523 [Paramyrothecium foliicola]
MPHDPVYRTVAKLGLQARAVGPNRIGSLQPIATLSLPSKASRGFCYNALIVWRPSVDVELLVRAISNGGLLGGIYLQTE